jgi:hypothetical protein
MVVSLLLHAEGWLPQVARKLMLAIELSYYPTFEVPIVEAGHIIFVASEFNIFVFNFLLRLRANSYQLNPQEKSIT